MTDCDGREYARMDRLGPGARVQVDGDFTCVAPWTFHTVKRAECGGLYIDCSEGGHMLDGQVDGPTDHVIGIYPI